MVSHYGRRISAKHIFRSLLQGEALRKEVWVIKICGKHDNAQQESLLLLPDFGQIESQQKEPDDTMIEVAIEAIKAVIPEDGSDIVSK